MSLFKDKEAGEVVKPEDVIKQTGISAQNLDLDEKDSPDEELENLVQIWIEQMESHIYTRLDFQIKENDKEFHAIQGILTGAVMNMITYALQQRTAPIIQLGDYAVDIIQASEVTKNLDDQLAPFQDPSKRESNNGKGNGRISVFWSTQKEDD